jgi:outer membrane immunogenic protein
MKKIFALALAAATMTAAPAMAQDFTGPRVEARVGMDSAKLNANAASASGLTYGGAIGYDIAVSPNVRLGATAALDSSTSDTQFAGLLRADAKRDIELGARLGYVVSPSTLVYGMAAYTNQRIGYSLDTKTGNVGIGHQTAEGYRVGGGVELAVTKHTFVKGEYRYSDYGSDVRSNQGLVGVGFRF